MFKKRRRPLRNTSFNATKLGVVSRLNVCSVTLGTAHTINPIPTIEKAKDSKLSDIIDESVTKTLSRTTLTSLTTFFVVLVLYLFGGEILKGFSFTLLVGVVVGTYSSIFIASPILMWLGFSVKDYKQMLADKKKRELEKEKLRNQFEQGVV